MGNLAGLALSMFGAGMTAKAQASSGALESDVLNQNAALEDIKGVDAIDRGQVDESNFRTSVRKLMGSQRSGYAAQGVDVGFGSPVDVAASTAASAELDALTIRTNAAREAHGHRAAAVDLRNRGKIAKATGKVQAVSTIVGAAGSYLINKYGFDKAQGS